MNNPPMACVIDDDQVYTFVMRRLMQKSNLIHSNTLFFENGKTALDYFTENHQLAHMMPDLILLDLNMPILDGWQFLAGFEKMIAKIEKKVSLYIVSSSIDDADHDRAKEFETVLDFIVKPIDSTKLHSIISQWNCN